MTGKLQSGRRPRCARGVDPLSRDAGFSLVECVVAIAIIGISAAAIIGAIGTAARTSSFHRGQADVEAGLRSKTEAIKAEPYLPCPAIPAYTGGAAATAPDRVTITVAAVEHWNGSAFQAACTALDAGFQRITLRALAEADRVDRTFEFVKRRP